MTIDEAKEKLKEIFETALALQAEIQNIDIKVSQTHDATQVLNAVNAIVAQTTGYFSPLAAPRFPPLLTETQ